MHREAHRVAEDGVILVSISEHEHAHLVMLMDEIFPGMRIGSFKLAFVAAALVLVRIETKDRLANFIGYVTFHDLVPIFVRHNPRLFILIVGIICTG
jgi:hypothetical protein